MPRRPFSKLCSSLLCAYCSNKLPERVPVKHRFVYCRLHNYGQLRAWARQWSAYAQLSPLYLLSTLYVTHVIKYSRPSTAFPYFKRQKAGRDLGTRLAIPSNQISHHYHLQPFHFVLFKVKDLVAKQHPTNTHTHTHNTWHFDLRPLA